MWLCPSIFSFGAKISGTVSEIEGKKLSYASILVKGSTRGTTTNFEGKFFLDLAPGTYTLICKYLGYNQKENTIKVENIDLTLDFQLTIQQLILTEVKIHPGGEDPAYAMIRHAIQKRKFYESPIDSFTCEDYIKTIVKLRHLPKKILGKKIDKNDIEELGVDSLGKGIIYLSENLTKIYFKKPDRVKLEVLSGRESGGNGFGFSFPTFINFYKNQVYILTNQLNPRGFISPIAESALNFYKYKFLGSFTEDGKEIDKILVIPKRKFEPLFSGTLNIVEDEWRIHSTDLFLGKESGLEILDTLEIKQMQVPISKDIWRTKDQVVRFTFNKLGIDALGDFINVYNQYDLNPLFTPKTFNRVIMKVDSKANKKSIHYWDSLRPVPLAEEEIKNYHKKDSVYASKNNFTGLLRNRDTLLKRQGSIKLIQVLYSGVNRSNFDLVNPIEFSFSSLISGSKYNTVEGNSFSLSGDIRKIFTKNKQVVSFSPNFRYGFGNTHFNAWATLGFIQKYKSFENQESKFLQQSWTLSGGKRISQFDPVNPISEVINGVYTLFFRENYLKIYENYFSEIKYKAKLTGGFTGDLSALYEDRIPLENSTNYSITGNKSKFFTPNYPYEVLSSQFIRHHAFITSFHLVYTPGEKYIETPDEKFSIHSDYPTLEIEYKHGWKELLGSKVDFDKWDFSLHEDINLKLLGKLNYNFGIGGFLNSKSVFIQDDQHFAGNQVFLAGTYLNSFQLKSYYSGSNSANLYASGHFEHHFNGLLTNKIPFIRNLSWNLVIGSNAFYVTSENKYVEFFEGLENIFKILRIDFIESYQNGGKTQFGIRLGFGGIFGGSFGNNKK